MRITLPTSSQTRSRTRALLRTRLPYALVLALIASGAAMQVVGAAPHPIHHLWSMAVSFGFDPQGELRLQNALFRAPARLVQSAAPLPQLALDIKFKHMQKLQQKRAEALERGMLVTQPGDFVPATLHHSGRTLRAKLRLKGDWLDHLESDRWSFRVKVGGADHVLGMRRFSLHHPLTRGFHSEVLFFATARKLDVLTPRYLFAEVVLNGSHLGIMAVEEHFSKELLEAQRRREGVILRFDESLTWLAREAAGTWDTPFADFHNTPVRTFRSKQTAASPLLSRQERVGVGLLRGFAEGSLDASEVFDTERVGGLLAAAQLWRAQHAVSWKDIRFYFNPVTARLEPIAFDAELTERSGMHDLVMNDPLGRAWLANDEIVDAYVRGLRQLSRSVLEGALVEELREVEERHLHALQREFPLLEPFSAEQLRERARYLVSLDREELLRPNAEPDSLPAVLHAYLIRGERGAQLELSNAVPYPVDVVAIERISDSTGERTPLDPPASVPLPIRLGPRGIKGSASDIRIPYVPMNAHAPEKFVVTAKLPGHAKSWVSEARPYHAALRANPIPRPSLEETLSLHPFLDLDAQQRVISVRPGVWNVAGWLNVPRGLELRMSAGTTLRFREDGGLIARGPLSFEGSEDAPITLEGASEDAGTWKGVAVLNAGPSAWTHVTVSNTTGVQLDGWELTGGVTFYESDVALADCRFEHNRAEDALNVVRSRFELRDVSVTDAASDAFDSDFSTGEVIGGVFERIGLGGGGDAIDVSGSDVRIQGTRIRDVGDKALSVGERSEVRATNLDIAGVGSAGVSKDGSVLYLSRSRIEGASRSALMAYIKKAEYGAARIEASQLQISDSSIAARAQRGSSITLDGRPLETESINVDALYQSIVQAAVRE